MKNHIIHALFLVAFLILGSTSCNKDLGPEYDFVKGAPKIISVTHSPIVVIENTPIEISATVSCPYGINAVATRYALNDKNSEAKLSKIQNVRNLKEYQYKDAEAIPGQPAGTKIFYYVIAESKFGIPATSEIREIEVIKAQVE